jgi:hypothetical protein
MYLCAVVLGIVTTEASVVVFVSAAGFKASRGDCACAHASPRKDFTPGVWVMLTSAIVFFGDPEPHSLFPIDEYGELLRYGVIGLVLNLVMATLTFLTFAKSEGNWITAKSK